MHLLFPVNERKNIFFYLIVLDFLTNSSKIYGI